MGEDWLTAAGYWPYGDTMREDAIGWRGSNAPHAVLESSETTRDSTLRAWYRDSEVTVLDLQRKASSGYTVNRLFARIGTTWIVIDSGDGADVQTNTIWQLSPTVEASDWYKLDDTKTSLVRSTRSSAVLALQVLLGREAAISQARGDREPFGGWVMYGGVPKPAPALVVTAPAGSWSGLAWRSAVPSDPIHNVLVRNIQWESSNEWIVELESAPLTTLERHGQRLTIRAGSESREVHLDRAPISEAMEMATRAYAIADQRYPPFRDYLPWRFKVFWFAMAAAVLQLIVLLAAWRWLRAHPRPGATFLFSLFLAHGALAVWLHLVYFAPS
jgi:hypothetical protein